MARKISYAQVNANSTRYLLEETLRSFINLVRDRYRIDYPGQDMPIYDRWVLAPDDDLRYDALTFSLIFLHEGQKMHHKVDFDDVFLCEGVAIVSVVVALNRLVQRTARENRI